MKRLQEDDNGTARKQIPGKSYKCKGAGEFFISVKKSAGSTGKRKRIAAYE